jgi:8-oxo-dGTP pyrophosphatase MutT (NUDIX family)
MWRFPTMTDPWTIRSSRYLLQRWWMSLREDHVVLPNGSELHEFHVVEYPDWACALCVTEDGRFVMVDQYRHGIGRQSLEFAAGAVDEGENPEEAARRELLEETGYASDDWFPVGTWAPEPSKHTNWAHLFVARSARRVADPESDLAEPLVVRLLGGPELRAAVAAGRMVHGVQLAALWKAAAEGLLPSF